MGRLQHSIWAAGSDDLSGSSAAGSVMHTPAAEAVTLCQLLRLAAVMLGCMLTDAVTYHICIDCT